jgi:hypothetical protein|tara:strand:+ start:356 stop:592 length:237 start_codon:yes stop_codon:yes gene_type:complete
MIVSIITYTFTGSLLGGMSAYSIYMMKLKMNSKRIYEPALVGPSPYLWIIPGLVIGGYFGLITRVIIIPTFNNILKVI